MTHQDFILSALEHNITILQKNLAGDLVENSAFTPLDSMYAYPPLPVSHSLTRQLQDEKNSASPSGDPTTQTVDRPSQTESNVKTSVCELATSWAGQHQSTNRTRYTTLNL